jgi:hypothetical protein
MNSIPASQLVNVIPSVLSAGGNPLSLNTVMLTDSTRVPIDAVQAFASVESVQNFFGPTSIEADLAAIYFNGFDRATSLPSVLYFSQFNAAAVGAYLRSATFDGVTLAQLNTLSGTLTTVVNGVSSVSLAINLASASSFSNAAALIQTGIQGGSPSSSATVTYDSQLKSFVIHSNTTGDASTIAFATGSLSAGLKLTSATGAVLSQGSAIATPAAAMAQIASVTQNWAAFMTTFEPITATMIEFAEWVQTTNDRFMYVGWYSDAAPLSGVAPTSFPGLVVAANMDGVVPIYEPATSAGNGRKAALVCGITASIDFEQTAGRVSYAYRGQAGLTADITDATQALNLELNESNFYGAYATANDRFVNLQRGVMPGAWNFIDAYVNQIWLNAALQLAFMELLTSINSLPYNSTGYNLLRAAALDPIQAALNNGVIQPGITLSNSQRAQVNTAAGANIADALQSTGYYLQILDADPVTRAARQSPPMTLWYTDGGSIQNIELSSIDVQ